ncbi:hypothetical protein L249_3386 [Ophiocordyceps polyrhachis-furcata BCC 54312]|uniref:Uncharacterized protein n=1 Tax=Ophiocordyceps polyrhachis-furcata BCC 54312 TaxID=1330021 RepID=A0A367LM08_9HYPO|nr:hypothetical protein L249_3386 [Ophiocordyceps polyrhachis-furcata BCC 54312]
MLLAFGEAQNGRTGGSWVGVTRKALDGIPRRTSVVGQHGVATPGWTMRSPNRLGIAICCELTSQLSLLLTFSFAVSGFYFLFFKIRCCSNIKWVGG